jgi:hypothetical protein
VLNKENLNKTLVDFGKYVVQQSRTNLTKGNINASKRLYNSLGYEVKVSKNSFQLSFVGEDYLSYIDEGVNGTQKQRGSRFSFGSKMPPPKAFDKWIIKRGLAPRENGKFVSRDSIKFAIAKSVQKNGIRKTEFFTKPFTKAYDKLPEEILIAYGLDLETFLQNTLNIK